MSRTTRRVKRQNLLAKSTSPAKSPHTPLRPKDIVFDKWTGRVRVKVS